MSNAYKAQPRAVSTFWVCSTQVLHGALIRAAGREWGMDSWGVIEREWQREEGQSPHHQRANNPTGPPVIRTERSSRKAYWERWVLNKRLDDKQASLTQWTWVWASSGRWWWTGKPGMLQSLGSRRVGHDWATDSKGWGGGHWEQWESLWKRETTKLHPAAVQTLAVWPPDPLCILLHLTLHPRRLTFTDYIKDNIDSDFCLGSTYRRHQQGVGEDGERA